MNSNLSVVYMKLLDTKQLAAVVYVDEGGGAPGAAPGGGVG